MAMEHVGLAGPAPTNPVDGSNAGNGSSEDDLLSALGAEDASEQTSGSGADASGKTGGDDLSRSPEASDDQGSGPADEAGQEDGQPRKRDRVQERIDELIARSKSAEESNRELKAQLDELRAKLEGKDGKPQDGDGSAAAFDPATSDPKFNDLSKQVTKAKAEADAARAMRRRLRTDPDAVVEMLKGKGIEVSDADGAADWLDDYAEAQRERYAEARDLLGQRKAEIEQGNAQAQRAWEAAAGLRYEWLKDESDPRHELIANARRQHPWVMKFPAGRAALAALADMAWHAKQQREGAGGTKPAGNPVKPGTVRPAGGGDGGGGPSARPGAAAGNPKGARHAELQRRLDQNPDDDEALAELLDGNL